MSKHYKVMKSNMRDRYKIEVTVKWFGLTIVKYFQSVYDGDASYDISFDTRMDAMDALKALDIINGNEVYYEC